MRELKIVNMTFIRGKQVQPGKQFTEEEIQEKYNGNKGDFDSLLCSGNAVLVDGKSSKKENQNGINSAKVPSLDNPTGIKKEGE